MSSRFKTIAATAALSMAAVSAQAALSVPAGNSLVVNDSVLQVIWTRDANLFKTQADSYAGGAAAFLGAVIDASGGRIYDTPNSLDTPGGSGYHNLTTNDFQTSSGTMNWWGAQAWVNYLNSIDYAGTDKWRLPEINPVNGSTLQWNVSFNGTTDRGFNTALVNATASELAHLYYVDLGNLASFNTAGVQQAGYGLLNSSPFSNFQKSPYWSGIEYLPAGDSVWVFSAFHGGQGTGSKDSPYYAIAVASVPEPQTYAMLLAGAVLIAAISRRSMCSA